MTFKQLKDKYLGKQVDIDGFPSSQKFQCTDWATVAVRELYGIYPGLFIPKNGVVAEGGAADAFDNFGYPNNFISAKDGELIANDFNDPNQVPSQGDILLFDRNFQNGFAGHIAIFDYLVDSNSFYSLDQNAPAPRVESVKHNFIGGYGFAPILGWIKIKKTIIKPPMNEETKNHIINTARNYYDLSDSSMESGLNYEKFEKLIVNQHPDQAFALVFDILRKKEKERVNLLAEIKDLKKSKK